MASVPDYMQFVLGALTAAGTVYGAISRLQLDKERAKAEEELNWRKQLRSEVETLSKNLGELQERYATLWENSLKDRKALSQALKELEDARAEIEDCKQIRADRDYFRAFSDFLRAFIHEHLPGIIIPTFPGRRSTDREDGAHGEEEGPLIIK